MGDVASTMVSGAQDRSKLELFDDNKYIPVSNPLLLDYERVECVIFDLQLMFVS